MIFNMYDFIFDGKSSALYGLKFGFIDNKDEDMNLVVNDFTTVTNKNGITTILDVNDKSDYTFSVYLLRELPIDDVEINKICKWLSPNDIKYRKLYINNGYSNGYYYNCRITNLVKTYISGFSYAIKCEIVCDSKYMYGKTLNYSYNTTTIKQFNLMCDNYNDEIDCIYKITSGAGDVTIINTTTNKTITLTGLSANEVVTISTEELSIDSNMRDVMLGKFNKVFPKLKNGNNKITVSGAITKLEISYTPKKLFRY